jgi:hypothetical protein
MGFPQTERSRELAVKLQAFMDEFVYPNETLW